MNVNVARELSVYTLSDEETEFFSIQLSSEETSTGDYLTQDVEADHQEQLSAIFSLHSIRQIMLTLQGTKRGI